MIGRRVVNFTEDFYNKGVQKVVDFDKMSENDEAFRGLDVLYCCLGTTRGKSGVVSLSIHLSFFFYYSTILKEYKLIFI